MDLHGLARGVRFARVVGFAVEDYAVMAATSGEKPYDFPGTGLPKGLEFHYTSDSIGGKTITPGEYSGVITPRDSTLPKPQTASVTTKLAVLPAKT